MSEPAKSHLHRCQGCGVIWGHGNMMLLDVEAHKCPKCGKSEWRVYSGLRGSQNSPAKRIVVEHADPYRAYLEALLTVAVIVMGAIFLGEVIAGWLLPRKG